MKTLAQELLRKNGISFDALSLQQFQDEDLNKTYDVYLVDTGSERFVLKSGRREYENYQKWFFCGAFPVPMILPFPIDADGTLWFLMEYLPGRDLRRADDDTVVEAVVRLAQIHSEFWVQTPKKQPEDRYSGYFRRFIPRFPESPALQNTLEAMITRMETCPRTLIHDDLLPINVQQTDKGIRFFDWDYCGIFPYFMDICRFLVHEAGELGSAYSQKLRKEAFSAYYRTLKESGCVDLSEETFWNDVRFGTIAELISCLQQEDRTHWTDFMHEYYDTIVDLSV